MTSSQKDVLILCNKICHVIFCYIYMIPIKFTNKRGGQKTVDR